MDKENNNSTSKEKITKLENKIIENKENREEDNSKDKRIEKKETEAKKVVNQEKIEENKKMKKEKDDNKNETTDITEINRPDKEKKKKRLIWVLIIALIALIVGYIYLRGSYLEVLEVGKEYISSFNQSLKTKTMVYLVNFVIVYVLVWFTNTRIKKGLENFAKDEKIENNKMPNKSIAFTIALIVTVFTSRFIYDRFVLFSNATQFEVSDPIFNLDLGFFIFQLPFIKFMFMYFMVAFLGLAIYMGIYYIISMNFVFDGIDRRDLKNSIIPKQISKYVLLFAIFLSFYFLANTFSIETEQFLNQQSSNSLVSSYHLYGAGISDVTIKLWGYRLLSLIIIVSTYYAIKSFINKKTKNMVLSIIVVPSYLLVMFLVLLVFNAAYVSPNEYDKQKRYINYNISATQNAYKISGEETVLSEEANIEAQDIENNQYVIDNSAIITSDLVSQDLTSSLTAKGYYTYPTTNIGLYNINGSRRLVYVSPREISSSSAYGSKTYEYTHGYGAIITSANEVDNNGNIINYQKGLDDSKENQVVAITQPRIYFGLQTNNSCVVNAKDEKEFDYPHLDSTNAENATYSYEGDAGLKLNFLDRLILSIKEGDFNLAFSSKITSDSKIITNRNILNRVKSILPSLTYDEEPYLVIRDNGSMVWVIDAYTETDCYPYSQMTDLKNSLAIKEKINYIRNSCKVIIDCYSGETTYYITDNNDPIIMAYQKMYPDLFSEKQIPEDIKVHLVYPKYLYNIQAKIAERYHSVQPDVLYRGDDVWEVATHNTGKVLTKTGTDFEPYYTIVKTIDSDDNNLGLVLPYTPKDKQNLISYTVGTSDGNGANVFKIYKYAADTNILGPMQLDTQIVQDESISTEVKDLNVTGMKLTKNMIIVPLNNKFLYIEAIFGQNINEEKSLQALKKVIVASGNKAAIGSDLDKVIEKLVSEEAKEIEVESTDSVSEVAEALIKANANLKKSSDANDWEMTGKDISKIQELIDKLEEVKKKEDEEKKKAKNEESANTINSNQIDNEIFEDVFAQDTNSERDNANGINNNTNEEESSWFNFKF